ncbi:MAG: hypothetical protein H8D23_22630 [Candidatus Brocadiales bacterium]|nr:hypothetical protein [Candidatus Brocadiales bacterium]
MYYKRNLSESFAMLLKPNGDLRWLFELIKQHPELDFLTGSNNAGDWVSVYRGLGRLLRIRPTSNPNEIKIDAHRAYQELVPSLYGRKGTNENFSVKLLNLVQKVAESPRFFSDYNNKKEGYYQNEFSRQFGICGNPHDEFVAIDKEAVIGYENQAEKDSILLPIQQDYQVLLKELSQSDPKIYGKNKGTKAAGNELDFIALNKDGEILLIEFKHWKNASGVYLSPFQIGGYYDLWSDYPFDTLKHSILRLAEQKQGIGLINPEWKIPEPKRIIPVLIISEYNYNSSAKLRFVEVLSFARSRKGNSFLESIQTYNFTTQDGLTPW